MFLAAAPASRSGVNIMRTDFEPSVFWVTIDRIAGRLHDRDSRQVCFEFIGDDTRQAGTQTLAHLAATDSDRDGAVGIHGNEHVGRERAADTIRCRSPGAGADAEDEQAACGAAGLQEIASR
jgi:hypothetical protein